MFSWNTILNNPIWPFVVHFVLTALVVKTFDKQYYELKYLLNRLNSTYSVEIYAVLCTSKY